MYWVYILQSRVDNNFYVGFSNNPEKRVKEHNTGQVKSTKGRKPFVLVYKESFETKELAIKKEKYLKGKGGIRFKKNLRDRLRSH